MYEVVAFPTIDLKRTGRRIERLRKDRGLSVRELQTYFGFENPQAIYKWQWGVCLPSVDNLFALAALLQVPMQDLLVGTDQEVPHFYTGSPLKTPLLQFEAKSLTQIIKKEVFEVATEKRKRMGWFRLRFMVWQGRESPGTHRPATLPPS